MSDSEAAHGDVFDVEKVRRLVELMNDHDLAEIDLRQADQRIRLRRGGDVQAVVTGSGAVPVVQASPAVAPVPEAGEAEPPGGEEDHTTYIRSPMVGTFYTAPSPDAEPFVNVGDHVEAETTVCIVEAMKVFNEIPAECAGQIVAQVADNGEPVEFGQPLFQVNPKK